MNPINPFSVPFGQPTFSQKLGEPLPLSRVANTSELSEEKINEMLSDKNLRNIFEVFHSDWGFEADGQALPFDKDKDGYELDLGSGGTKDVFQCQLNNESVAIAIFGSDKNTAVIAKKWRKVLNEPRNTEEIRKLGLLVNDRCEIKLIKINGYEFPAIVMKPYLSHNFEIHDKKNFKKNQKTQFDWRSIKNHQQMVEACSEIIKDIAKLVSAHIRLNNDNVNLAIENGKPRLFISDLDNNLLIDKDTKQKTLAEYLIKASIKAFTILAYQEQPSHGLAGIFPEFAPYFFSIEWKNDELKGLILQEVEKELKCISRENLAEHAISRVG